MCRIKYAGNKKFKSALMERSRGVSLQQTHTPHFSSTFAARKNLLGQYWDAPFTYWTILTPKTHRFLCCCWLMYGLILFVNGVHRGLAKPETRSCFSQVSLRAHYPSAWYFYWRSDFYISRDWHGAATKRSSRHGRVQKIEKSSKYLCKRVVPTTE